MVEVGAALGLIQLLQLKPELGCQLYDRLLPEAVAFNVVLNPEQMVSLDPTLTVGSGLTETFTWSVAEQPFVEVTVKVYVVLAVGVATGF